MNDFLDQIQDDFASNEDRAGEVTGFVLITFHGQAGYMLTASAGEDDEEAQDFIEEVSAIMQSEDGGMLQ